MVNNNLALPRVSIIIPTYNRSNSINSCIDSLLQQTYSDFELIVCDDCSTDDTVLKVESYDDRRIRIIKHKINGGPAAARNSAILQAVGSIIFFVDDDVTTPANWLATGLKYFDDTDVQGVEGRIVYVSPEYKPRYSDRIVQNTNGRLYMTANIAYRKKALLSAGLFDTELRQYEDRMLGFKIREMGEIKFAIDFYVTHQRETYTIKNFFGEGAKVKYRIICLVKSGDRDHFRGPFYEPLKFLVILCPVLLITRVRSHRFETKYDWLLLFLAYPRLWYERMKIWETAFNERIIIL